MTTWVYKFARHVPKVGDCWTVGFYDPQGEWHAESDHFYQDKAAERCAWLNGGPKPIEEEEDEESWEDLGLGKVKDEDHVRLRAEQIKRSMDALSVEPEEDPECGKGKEARARFEADYFKEQRKTQITESGEKGDKKMKELDEELAIKSWKNRLGMILTVICLLMGLVVVTFEKIFN